MVLVVALSTFVVVAVPALLFLAIWTAITALRILYPERSLPLRRDGAAERREARARGDAVGVGFREIHEDLRAQTRELARTSDDPVSRTGGIPEAWLDDLHRRRN